MANIRALTEFVNLADSHKAWERLSRHHSHFFWPEVYQSAKVMQESGHFEKHPVHDWKVMLRSVWTAKDEQGVWLRALLGLGENWGELYPELKCRSPEEVQRWVEEPDTPPDHGWDDKFILDSPARRIRLDWQRGEFTYSPSCEFEGALYWLFRNSWRAKVCPECGTYFIARKNAQRYCSTDCRDLAQRAVKLRYWREHGKKLRAKKSKRRKRS